jgi:hypothetical protein
LPEVPIDQYLITVDAGRLASSGFRLENQPVDLAQTIEANVELPLEKIEPGIVRTRVQDSEGRLLPFAWISLEKEGSTHQLPPGAGTLEIYDLPELDQPAIASAPGYFSQAAVLSPDSNDNTEINLAIRPETLLIPWGDGLITLPPESVFEQHGLDIQFDRGWLWGEGGGEQPLIIYMPGAVITIEQGKFALENIPGKTPWLYVWDGEANIALSESGESISVASNQMVAITEKGKPNPVTLDPVVTAAVQPGSLRPFDPVWQPGLRAQMRDRLALIGIGTAQLITFITYLLVFLSIILFPLYWVYSSYRKRSVTKPEKLGIEDI